MPLCIFRLTFLYFLYLINSCSCCTTANGKYDLSSLNGVFTVIDAENPDHRYDISLCGPLKYEAKAQQEACQNSSICVSFNKTALSLGDYLKDPIVEPNAINNHGFIMFFSSKKRCDDNIPVGTSISFICGQHLGSPQLTSFGSCRAYFIWESSVACKTPPKAKEASCYRYNDKGMKVDLSPLIKQTGGYLVDTGDPKTKLVINVCSNIINDNSTATCPDGVASCRIDDAGVTSFGSVSGGLESRGEGLLLEYDIGTVAAPCKRRTFITFRCPNRTKSSPPRVIYSDECNYQVLWETEHACPEDVINGNFTTCRFTENVHGVDLDLSPLRKHPGFYNITGPVNGTQIPKEFYLNICGTVDDTTCRTRTGAKHISACMFDPITNVTTIIGTRFSPTLRYADAMLSLTYKGVASKDTTRMDTVINFICSKEENGPEFINSNEFAHTFQWRTIHACVKTVTSIPCYVFKDGKKIDLSRLQHNRNSSWLVNDKGLNNDSELSAFFIGVCEENAVGCPPGSSFCKRGVKKEIVNLGKFESPPYYDAVTDSVILEYKNGARCLNNINWKSVIHFICKPGHPQATPILTSVNAEECTAKIEWHTAEACPLEVLTGTDCKIHSPNLAMNFDFTPLKASVHNIEAEQQMQFYISVCGALTNTPCSNADGAKKASVCEVNNSTGTPQASIIGEINNTLVYKDGVISLTYLYPKGNTTILFMCDPSSGLGEPMKSLEENGSFVFHWFTELACQEQSDVDCSAIDPKTNELYDLNSLSRSDQNWEVHEHDAGSLTKSYINLCRLLVPQANCSRNAAICIVEVKDGNELQFVPNAGTVVTGPEIKSDGHLQLVYSHGVPCTAFGEAKNLTSVIHFMCQKGASVEQGPKYIGKIGECQYTYLWSTRAACPTGDAVVKNNCDVADPETGFNLDISSLANHGKPYKFSAENKTYEMNFCLPVKEGCLNDKNEVAARNIGACQIDSNGKFVSTLVASNPFKLYYPKGQDLQLIYESKNATSPGIVVRFPCTTNNVSKQPEFLRKEGNMYILEMKTSLTCQMESFTCKFADVHGRTYDLTPLSGEDNLDWIAVDTRKGFMHLRYHISFCEPLNRNGTSCSGGAVSVCEVDSQDKSHNGVVLGSQYQKPTVNDDGVIRMTYINGAPCHDDVKSSTYIDLICSQRQGPLVFIGVTYECEYLFSLNTPAACPLEVVQGSDCTVQEPVFGYMFDLSPLKPIEISVDQYTYSLSVCKGLTNVTGDCIGAAVCQTKPSNPKFAKSLGLPSSELTYEDGTITLKYDHGSGDCHQKHNRSTIIKFTCDHEVNESLSWPQFVSEEEDCSYMFVWPTVYACPSFKTIECSVQDKDGNLYDLTPLSVTDGNYYIKHPWNQNQTFVINVCRSVVHTKESICPYSAATCLLNFNATDPLEKAVNLGQAQRGPYIVNGKLQMKYTFGSPCKKRGSLAFLATVINFICDKSVEFSEPEFIGQDDCNYYFDWRTSYACVWEEPMISGNCAIADPQTGYVYNLTSLKSNTSYQVNNTNHLFKLNVCGPVTGSACDKAAGMCQEEVDTSTKPRKWSGGKSNAELQLRGDMLMLNYSDGASCHGERYNRSTIIKFRCGSGTGQPVFAYETYDCTYFFSWETELACHPLIHCAVKNGTDHYDLSLLNVRPYLVAESTIQNDTATYYVSVCGPLGPIPGVFCPPLSSICRVTTDGLPQSLGRVEMPPFVDFHGYATALYTNGSICTGDQSERLRSRIIFVCDPTELLGEPKLIDYDPDNCYYIFEWRSSIVCQEKPAVNEELTPCIYKDIGRGIYFDLSSTRLPGSYYEVNGTEDAGTYLLNVCGTVSSSALDKCANSSVCFQSNESTKTVKNYGLASSQLFRYSGNRLTLHVDGGDDCPFGASGKRASEIIFVCNPDAGIGHPTLHKEYACTVIFMWETSTVCRNMQHQCSFNLDGSYYDFYLLSSLSHNWNTTDNKKNTYWLNLCRGIRQDEQTAGCPPSAAVCMKSEGSHMPLGMVYSVKIKKQNSSSLLLTYESHSTQPCMSIKSNKSLTATTRIFLQCGPTLGSPKIIDGPDSSCYYDFLWKTSVACEENVEEVSLDEKGALFEKDLNYSMDLSPILNKRFNVSGSSATTDYFYIINLGGNTHPMSPQDVCKNAAVCQTHDNGLIFMQRDIGTISTRKFYRRGSELHVNFTSLERSCGKSKNRNVTTVFILVCSTASKDVGKPVFLYESGGCDYIFEWGTYVVCSDFHRPDKPDGSVDKQTTDGSSSASSHKAAIVISLLLVACIGCYVVFVVSNPNRRASAAAKFRSCFSRVTVPRFRYKRGDMLTELQSDF